MKYIGSIKRLSGLVVLYGLLIILLITTDPYKASLPIVILPFGLLFVALLCSFNLVFQILPISNVTPKKRLVIAAGAAWLPVMLLILRSIDQLTLRDGLIMTIFITALLLYASRTNFIRR